LISLKHQEPAVKPALFLELTGMVVRQALGQARPRPTQALVIAILLGCTLAQAQPRDTGAAAPFEAERTSGAAPAAQAWSGLDVRQWRFQLRSDLHSDALELRYFGQKNWSDNARPRSGMNLVQIDQSVSMSVGSSAQGHQLGWTRRQMGRLVASEDTVRRMGQIDRGEHAPESWNWRPDLLLKGFSGEGLDWTYRSFSGAGWSWEGGLQWLRLSRLYGRELTGTVSYDAADQSYGFQAQSLQVGSNLKLPFQKPVETLGQALLVHGHIHWRSESFGLSAGLRDWGQLRWAGLPQQVLRLNSSTSERDENGFIVYKPSIQGQNSQPVIRWRAPYTLDVAAHWRLGSAGQFSLQGERVPDFGWLPSLRWSRSLGSLDGALQWRMHQRDLLMQAQWHGWSVALSSQNFRRKAHSQVWTLAYLHRF
jgi:hypothetical protein